MPKWLCVIIVVIGVGSDYSNDNIFVLVFNLTVVFVL